MQEIKFWCYFVLARLRGIGRAYNAMPKGESVSTGIHKVAEVRTMFFRHGWVPYCLTGRGGSFVFRAEGMESVATVKAERDQLAAENEALQAEIEALRADLAESDEIRDNLRHLLTRTAAALKGEPPEGVWHSWHDLPEKATQLTAALRELEKRVQRDEALLKQAMEVLSGQRGEPDWHTGRQREDAIAALRERLASGHECAAAIRAMKEQV